jgi:glycosyltransferase involved in cell wall biosynthesis
MKISVIVMAYNCITYIDAFVQSLLLQKPDQIVFVDGGSTDGTREYLEKYKGKEKFQVYIERHGKTCCNIKRFNTLNVIGENIGVLYSTGDIIVITDAENLMDQGWLKEITKPFKENADIVVGNSIPCGGMRLDKIFYTLGKHRVDLAKDIWRNIAFKRGVFGVIKDNPDILVDTPDSQYNIMFNRLNIKYIYNPNAIVYYVTGSVLRRVQTWKDLYNKHFRYSQQERRYKLHRDEYIFKFLKYALGLTMFFNMPLFIVLLVSHFITVTVMSGRPALAYPIKIFIEFSQMMGWLCGKK